MSPQLKGVIIVALVAILSFPVMYIVMMLATGNARVEFSKPKVEQENNVKIKEIKRTAKIDSLTIRQSNTFLALQNENNALAKEREKMSDDKTRLETLKQEIETSKNELITEREKLDKLSATVPELEAKRIKQLAKVYSSMRADEAAKILETLDDGLVAKIISAMNDDRQKAKILSSISKEKASRISEKISKAI